MAAPSLPAVLIFYVCLAVMWRSSGRRRVVWIAVGGVGLLLCWWTWSPRLWLDGDQFRVTFLDVGQGDSAVLELPAGEVVLIDGGGSYERFDMGQGIVGPYLWNRGIRKLDYVIATHPQLDHVGGLPYILSHFSVQHYWGTGDVRGEPFYQRLERVLAEQGLGEHIAHERQDVVRFGKCLLEVLNPADAADRQPVEGRRSQAGHALNNRSIVTALTCGSHRLVFTADVEAEALIRMSHEQVQGAVDLVKVPHHGAASSYLREWVDAVRPRYAVISVGRHNAYGHPARAVVQAYAHRGIATYRTDRDGAVWVTGRCSDADLVVHLTRAEQPQRVPFPECLWSCERSNWERLIHRWSS